MYMLLTKNTATNYRLSWTAAPCAQATMIEVAANKQHLKQKKITTTTAILVGSNTHTYIIHTYMHTYI